MADKKRLSKRDIELRVGQMIDDSQSFIQEDLARKRTLATEYYHAKPYGNEEDGRSKVVTTEVRDAVQAAMPSLMRVFVGPERVVEFRPRGGEDEPQARQQTDYVNYVFLEDNPGFLILHDAFKDGLVRKTGFVKWGWDESESVVTEEYTGLNDQQLLVLVSDDSVELEITAVDDGDEEPVYSATVRRTNQGRVTVEAVPPEEILWNRNARSLEDARIVVHSRELMLSDLVAMGYDIDDVEPLAGASQYPRGSEEEEARRFDDGASTDFEETQFDATRPVRYDEAYVWLDREGDGIVSLYRVCMAGDAHEMLDIVPVSHIPLADFCPDPEPHTMVGLSWADYTMDLQKINSAVLRGTLDSLSLSIHQRTEAVEGQVNMKDLLNTEVGGVIRVRAPGMIREIKHSFVGGDTLPFMQYIGEIKENRLGISKASAGLDADALQSSTKAAVAATMSGAQQHLEMLARVFAETGMKKLFKGLLRTVVEHQDFKRTVRLRNEYVSVDPRAWDANMDVIVNVALGNGLPEDRLQYLLLISQKQETILQQLGLMNPLVTLTQYRNTLARMVELVGFKNADEFYQPITPEIEQQFQQQMAQAQEGQTDPQAEALVKIEEMKAQVAMKKAESDAMIAMQRLQLDREKMMLEDDRKRDQTAADIAVRISDIQARTGVQITQAEINAMIAQSRAMIDAEARRDVADIQAEASQRRSDGNTDGS
jgi:hypothetical protein